MTEPESLLDCLRRLDKEATPMPWRAGRSVHRTLYCVAQDDDDSLIGMMDDTRDVTLIVALRNAWPEIIEAFELVNEARTQLEREHDWRREPHSVGVPTDPTCLGCRIDNLLSKVSEP